MNKLSDAYEYLKGVYINMVNNAVQESESNDRDDKEEIKQLENKDDELKNK